MPISEKINSYLANLKKKFILSVVRSFFYSHFRKKSYLGVDSVKNIETIVENYLIQFVLANTCLTFYKIRVLY